MGWAIYLILTELTAVELHLLHALDAGSSNKHIARALGKSEFTVRNQFSTLFKKVNVSNRTQAAGWYREYVERNGPVELRGGNGTSVPLPASKNTERIGSD